MELSLEAIVLYGVPVVLAITLHEAAHGYVARLFGDDTAAALGRVTLNPVKHVDAVGTILVPGLLMLLKAPFLFGWAKPVPVDASRLRHPRRDMIWVAAAGPGSNFVQAVVWAFASVAAVASGSEGFARMANIGVQVNVVLMALNLLPIRRSTADGSSPAYCRRARQGSWLASSRGDSSSLWDCCCCACSTT